MSDSIGPTAHYTAAVWARNGLSHPAFSTRQGRLLYASLQPTIIAAGLLGSPNMERMLLARHRLIDERLIAAIEAGRVGQVIELAAGLSPRGWRMTRRFGDRLDYVETDLPSMAERKRRALGKVRPKHDRPRVVEVDAFAEDGPLSLAALAEELDPRLGLAVISEGLLNYFDRAAVRDLWRRVAGVLGGFPRGVYLSDLVLSRPAGGLLPQAFVNALSLFVRGRVHLHFADAAETEGALRAAGFAEVDVHDPRQVGPSAGEDDAGVGMVRVIEAGVARG